MEKILYFKIENILIFKILIEILSKLTNEITWVFISPDNDNDSEIFLEISGIDTSKTVYYKIDLNSELFKSYKCKEKLELGINLENLNEIFKLIDDENNKLYFYVTDNNKEKLIIKIKHKQKKTITIYELKLLESIQHNKKPSKIEFDKRISIPPKEFNQLCKEMNSISEYVKIVCDNEKIIFSCEGTCANRTTTYIADEDDIIISNDNDKKVKGIYELKNIVLFSKCSNSKICSEFNIYMKNDFALTIIYNFFDYGSIKIAFSPIKEETITNICYSYSDDEEELNPINNNFNLIN